MSLLSLWLWGIAGYFVGAVLGRMIYIECATRNLNSSRYTDEFNYRWLKRLYTALWPLSFVLGFFVGAAWVADTALPAAGRAIPKVLGSIKQWWTSKPSSAIERLVLDLDEMQSLVKTLEESDGEQAPSNQRNTTST